MDHTVSSSGLKPDPVKMKTPTDKAGVEILQQGSLREGTGTEV